MAAEYCTCDETPRVIRQEGTGSGGGQVAVVGNNAGHGRGGGRSRRSRMRETPRRFQAADDSNSSEILTYEEAAPITIVSNEAISSSIGAAGARPFRIRDIVSRQDTMLRSFGSGLEVNHSRALSVRRTSRDSLIDQAQILSSIIEFNLQSLRNLVLNTTRVIIYLFKLPNLFLYLLTLFLCLSIFVVRTKKRWNMTVQHFLFALTVKRYSVKTILIR